MHRSAARALLHHPGSNIPYAGCSTNAAAYAASNASGERSVVAAKGSRWMGGMLWCSV